MIFVNNGIYISIKMTFVNTFKCLNKENNKIKRKKMYASKIDDTFIISEHQLIYFTIYFVSKLQTSLTINTSQMVVHERTLRND